MSLRVPRFHLRLDKVFELQAKEEADLAKVPGQNFNQ